MRKVDGPFYLVELNDEELIAKHKTETCTPWVEYTYKNSVILGCECEGHHCDCKVVTRHSFEKSVKKEKVVAAKVEAEVEVAAPKKIRKKKTEVAIGVVE